MGSFETGIMEKKMDITSQFIENYKKKKAYYETSSRIAAEHLEAALQSAGIRAIVSYRAKAPTRLKSKVLRRNASREVPYRNMKEIYEDIVDLAGVRISLYFPGDRIKTDKLVNELFNVIETKHFPDESKAPTYSKRFSGYWANHYRVSMKEDTLEKTEQKYASVHIEIQVASVLMHAWSEVEHDLVYKPIQGNLSEEELAIVDELNGLVLTGEIALERLQNAGNQRVLNKNAEFNSQYDLASYLYNYLSSDFNREDVELRMGNIELLFRLISTLHMNGVKEIEPVLKAVKFEKDRRNISQQIIDQIITGNKKRYEAYQSLRRNSNTYNGDIDAAITDFFLAWVPLENALNRMTYKNARIRGPFNINTLKRMHMVDPEIINRIISLRKLRNMLIHDIEVPSVEDIKKYTDRATEVYEQICI